MGGATDKKDAAKNGHGQTKNPEKEKRSSLPLKIANGVNEQKKVAPQQIKVAPQQTKVAPQQTKVAPQQTKSNQPKSKKVKYSFPELTRKIMKAYTPIKVVFSIFGRFPLSLSKSANGTLTFVVKEYSGYNISFFVTSFFNLLLFVLFIVNCVGLNLNSPKITQHKNSPEWHYEGSKNHVDRLLHWEEWFMLRRNSLPCVIILSSSLHIVVCSWNWMWKRHFVADFMNYWAITEYQTHLEVTGHTLCVSVCLLVAYGFVTFCFAVTIAMHMTPICTGIPAVLVQMILRCFYPDIHTSNNFIVYRNIAVFIFVYLMLCSKLYIMLFMIHCYMITHTIREWNYRVEEALHGEKTYTEDERIRKRSNGLLLFQDQVSLLDLIEGNDTLFGNIIESYYLSEITIVVFEVYFIYRIELNSVDFSGIRSRDRIFIIAHLIFTLGSMLLVSIFAGQIGEETLNGIQSVRNKGLLGRKDETQLNLVLSMYYNYVGYWETVVNGAKYFQINKQLFMKALAVSMSYLFFLVQFEMEFTYTPEIDDDSDNNIAKQINFLRLVENMETTSKGWWSKKLKGETYYTSPGSINQNNTQ